MTTKTNLKDKQSHPGVQHFLPIKFKKSKYKVVKTNYDKLFHSLSNFTGTKIYVVHFSFDISRFLIDTSKKPFVAVVGFENAFI